MHNSRKRSYIQILLPEHYECLWSAVFRDHEKITPELFRRLIDYPGWTKEALGALKDHVGYSGDPLTTFRQLHPSPLWAEAVPGGTDEHHSEGGEEEHQSEPDSVSQEF